VLRARGGDDAVIGCAVREPVVTVCGHDARAIAARPERRVCLARGASVELDRDDTAHEQLEHVRHDLRLRRRRERPAEVALRQDRLVAVDAGHALTGGELGHKERSRNGEKRVPDPRVADRQLTDEPPALPLSCFRR
jgi:hypothetical protein